MTPKKEGKVIITAKASKKSYKCTVTVKKPYISDKAKTIYVGKSYTLKLYGTEIKSAKSSNTEVATVNKKGKVTAKNLGTATITLKGKNGKSYKCTITTKRPYLSEMHRTLEIGETFTLKLNGATAKSIYSTNKKVVTVNKKGKVTAKKVGTAYIGFKDTKGEIYTCSITVKKKHNWVEAKIIKEATCKKAGIKLYVCYDGCGAEKKEKYTDKNAHSYEWKVTKEPSKGRPESEDDFGSRTATCKLCKAKGLTETMINIGDQVVCGVFEERHAEEICYWVNRQRREGCWYTISDGIGNHVAVGTPCSLTRDDELDFMAKVRAAECAVNFTLYDENGKPLFQSDSEVLAYGYLTPVEAFEAWFLSEDSARELTDFEYWYNGAAVFWNDSDGSGKGLFPIWVMNFNKEFYQTHVPIRFVTQSRVEFIAKYGRQAMEWCKRDVKASDVTAVTEKNCDALATNIGLYANDLFLRTAGNGGSYVELVEDVYSEDGKLLYKKGYYTVYRGTDFAYTYLIDDAPADVKENYGYKGQVTAKDVILNDGDPYIKGKFDEDYDMVHLTENVLHPQTGEVLYKAGYYQFSMITDKGGIIYTDKTFSDGSKKCAWYIPEAIWVYRDSSCASILTRQKITQKP
ncbi:MAG: Ig-like domain-containing protein [Agathobacter sp.]|nr:Ig-like domain-containing protein [Agathobacter sp.]